MHYRHFRLIYFRLSSSTFIQVHRSLKIFKAHTSKCNLLSKPQNCWKTVIPRCWSDLHSEPYQTKWGEFKVLMCFETRFHRDLSEWEAPKWDHWWKKMCKLVNSQPAKLLMKQQWASKGEKVEWKQSVSKWRCIHNCVDTVMFESLLVLMQITFFK